MKELWSFAQSVLVVLLLKSVGANIWKKPKTYDNETDILEEWKNLDKNIKTVIQSLIKTAMPTVLEMTNEVNLSSQCTKESFKLIAGLRQLKLWAVSFIDSSTKGPVGFLSLSPSSYGEYDQCLDTVVPHPKLQNSSLFRGQYCIAEVRFPMPPQKRVYKYKDHLEELKNFSGSETMTYISGWIHLNYFMPLRLGICVPSGCSLDDINQLAKYVEKKTRFLIEVPYCEVKRERIELLTIQICAIICCSILFFLLTVGTWFDVYKKKYDCNQGKVLKLVCCFSVASNFKKFIQTKATDQRFRSLHGVRFLTITWVVHGHAYLYPSWYMQNSRALLQTDKLTQQPVVQMLVNSSESVDTFFFMAGMLLCFFTVTRVSVQKKSFNISLIVLHRLWRIVPVYYFIVLCYFLIPLMGSGPMFHDIISEEMGSCFQYWWRNLLFINNMFNLQDACFMHTWYISTDMQLYFITLVALYILVKYPRAGVIILLTSIAASILFIGFFTYYKRVPPLFNKNYLDPIDRNIGYLYNYANTISRLGPYFIGVLVGYTLATRPKIKLTKGILILGWSAATVSSCLVIFFPASWNREPSVLASVMYGALYKIAFTGGIGWMIFCCVSGYGGILNTFLSWKFWTPLGRLTFLIYLIQPALEVVHIASFRYAQENSHLQAVINSFGYLCISGLLALVCVMLVESPFLAMEKILFGREEREEAKLNGGVGLETKKSEMTSAVDGRPAITTVI